MLPINPANLAPYADLRHHDTERGGTLFIAEGHLVVQRLLASRYAVQSVLVQEGHEATYRGLVSEKVAVYTMSRPAICELVGFHFHRGVLACGIRQPFDSVEVFHKIDPMPPLSLALLGVSEAENVGSILRSAAAFGINHIFVDRKTIDPFCRRVIRVSMANVLKHRFFLLSDPPTQLAQLSCLRTVASTLDPQAATIDEIHRDGRPMLLMMGNEATGLDRQLQRIASQQVRIPMQLGTDSLNVAVAAAILMQKLGSVLKRSLSP